MLDMNITTQHIKPYDKKYPYVKVEAAQAA